MATLLFSTHSSNPLEVHSSDARNLHYTRLYTEAKQQRENVHQTSSDDPTNDLNAPQLEQYHNHIQSMYPNYTVKPARGRIEDRLKMVGVVKKRDGEPQLNGPPPKFVDLDEDMSDDVDAEGEDDDEYEEEFQVDMLGENHELGQEECGQVQDDVDADLDEEPFEEDEDDEDDALTDEETTILLKPPEEQEEIVEEIADLEACVPQLTPDYKLIDRLGTGTFSSVYKAIDLGYHTKWDNTPWHGSHPPSSSAYYQTRPKPSGSKVYVAVKRIYVTSGPERIRNEISIMEDCRSCRHVSQLITAFRQYDQVVAIMPYHKNDDFRDYFRTLPLEGIKQYFRCLFRAFRDVHTRGIIHRDVKPANFLFDPRTGIGTLCDFGLACRMERGQTLGACNHTPPTRHAPHGKLRSSEDLDYEMIKTRQRDARLKSSYPSDRVGYPEKDSRPHSKANRAGTRGFRAPEVLLKCGSQSGAIDVWSAGMILLFFLTGKFPLFQSNDDVEALMEIATIIGRRRMEKVATLHSRIFQTNVPSITSEGISWKEFVERQNPNLRVPPKPDPRYYPYSLRPQPHASSSSSSHKYAAVQPPPSSSSPKSRFSASRSPSPQFEEVEPAEAEEYSHQIDLALDLLGKLMHPESTRRITPREVLYHKFLYDPSSSATHSMPSGSTSTAPSAATATSHASSSKSHEPTSTTSSTSSVSSTSSSSSLSTNHPHLHMPLVNNNIDDDEYVPYPFGEGVCAEDHFYDDVTEEPCVRIRTSSKRKRKNEDGDEDEEDLVIVRRLCAGEGVAIGRRPCEFHQGMGYE
ncbi:hypothetical protein ABKN59_005629 [Abortiporus biennis]